MAEDSFADHLLKGEHVLWSGKPAQGLLFMPRDTVLIPFSLMWCGFAVFWTTSVFTTGHAVAGRGVSGPGNILSFFTLWGLMFVCIGLFFAVGRFILDIWLRRRTAYAVTNRRILIARSAPFARFIAISRDRLPECQLTEDANGRGTIRFGLPVSVFGNRNMSGWVPALDPTPQFLAIDNVRHVFDLVQRSDA